MQVCINITNNVTVEANFSITIQTDAEEGTADIGDFEMFENEIIVSTGHTCFEIRIFLDAILEDKETFQVFMESTDLALNVVVPQARVTILDSTGKFIVSTAKKCWNGIDIDKKSSILLLVIFHFDLHVHQGFRQDFSKRGENHLTPLTYQETVPITNAKIHLWKNSRCL